MITGKIFLIFKSFNESYLESVKNNQNFYNLTIDHIVTNTGPIGALVAISHGFSIYLCRISPIILLKNLSTMVMVSSL